MSRSLFIQSQNFVEECPSHDSHVARSRRQLLEASDAQRNVDVDITDGGEEDRRGWSQKKTI
jgi:hypothetical protein